MQKTLRMLLTGAMIVTALTACGKDAAKKPASNNQIIIFLHFSRFGMCLHFNMSLCRLCDSERQAVTLESDAIALYKTT